MGSAMILSDCPPNRSIVVPSHPLRRSARDRASLALKVVGLALVYHLAARIGLQLAYVQINTSPVWPALLTFGIEVWPGLALGVLLGSLLTRAPWQIAVGITIGNTLEAVVGLCLLRRVVRLHNAIDRIQDVVGLAAVAMAAAAISASVGAVALGLSGLGGRGKPGGHLDYRGCRTLVRGYPSPLFSQPSLAPTRRGAHPTRPRRALG